jgi:rapamycin-insensitive companion of mTOR
VLIDVQSVARAGDMRVLLQILSESPPALASLLSPVFPYILDSPCTRKHFRPGEDLEVRQIDSSYDLRLSLSLISYGKDSEHQRRLKDI